MRLAISIPQLDTAGFDATAVRNYLSRAEQAGFESGWVLEQVVGPTPFLAPLELLAWSAAVTERLRLGVGVLVSSLHDPLQLAASITAVDRLSHGRLDVGVAPGGGFRAFRSFGVNPETFVASFTEGLQLMKMAWSDAPTVTFQGRFRQVEQLPIQPKPVQRPHPPIWFGANAPRAIARAVRHGDAFLGAGSTSTANFAKQIATLRGELERQGRDPATFPIAKRVYLMVDDDVARARSRVQSGLRRIYGTSVPGIEDVPVAGTPHDVVDGLRAVRKAGAEMLLLNPVGADVSEDREQLERLIADVIPQLE
ncbi:MAG: LLM class flavin-dependent oxidoreductase [Chloroflexi bacterium]|nr:LLM class flavin-dependent oxidoreductase [Chloroflexota bacterium]